jgi:hypothetical protein
MLIPSGHVLATHADHRRYTCDRDWLILESQSTNCRRQCRFCGFDLDKMGLISPAPHTIGCAGSAAWRGWRDPDLLVAAARVSEE